MEGEACVPHYVEGFVSQRMCEAAVPKLAETIQPLVDDKPVRIDAKCITAIPDREV
jgi:hypothetical protein